MPTTLLNKPKTVAFSSDLTGKKVISATCSLIENLAIHPLGSLLAIYQRDVETNRIGLLLIPAARERELSKRREFLDGIEISAYAQAVGRRYRAVKVDSLIQLKERSDSYSAGFAQGRTMRNSGTIDQLLYKNQTTFQQDSSTTIRTRFEHAKAGWNVFHDLIFYKGSPCLESCVTVENTSAEPITLEFLSSFSLGGISPFAEGDSSTQLLIHRFRSNWSNEGRLETLSAEALQLERSWSGWAVRNERFGVVGSMPVSGFFPFIAIEDRNAGVTWGAQLAHPGSWQMEAYRRDDTLSISGGLADLESGHWSKKLAPGETFTSPRAAISCVVGNIDTLCTALLAAQEQALEIPAIEKKLPVIFNDWATTWGKPTHDNMLALAQHLEGSGVKYLVMDAGWFVPPVKNGSSPHGDWQAQAHLYPEGLRATADAIRARGFIPGIWFEMETAGGASALFKRKDLLLQRHDQPLTVGDRRFLDFRNPATHDYLAERVIDLLREGNFGYLKIDYNENIGFGVDGIDSPAEELRKHLVGVQDFFRRIRRELPDLVIESCASGGHRLEPSFFALSAMSSSSDAHECLEIPIIAANLHRLMLPRQNQVWAVLRQGESPRRTIYSLAAGFLGRLCLSGDILKLSDWQMQTLHHATALYAKAAPLIAAGISRRHGPEVISYRHATGWQVLTRQSPSQDQILVIGHTFASPTPAKISVDLPSGSWKLNDGLWLESNAPTIANNQLEWNPLGEWNGFVALLDRRAE